MSHKHNSTWYVIHGGNDIVWRVKSPADLLDGKLNVIRDVGGYFALTMPNDDTDFRWHMALTLEDGSQETVTDVKRYKELAESRARIIDCRQVYPDHEGVAVWTRPDLCRATHAKAMRQQHGIRTVAEVDDNYLSDPDFNYFMRSSGFSKQDRLDHLKSVASMNAIIVSTEYLRDTYYKAIKEAFGKKSVPEIHVCGNHIDDRYKVKRVPPRKDGKLRIGFMGSDSHVWDVNLIFPALKWANDNGHEVVFIGIDPAGGNAAWKDEINYTHVPWTVPEEYERIALPLDIGLAPVLSNKHTFGKSDIKGMEYLLSGAAPILQNNLIYNRSFKHGETALLAGSPEEFWIWTQRLVNDPELRTRLVEQGNQYIREERMIEDHRKEWSEAVFGV